MNKYCMMVVNYLTGEQGLIQATETSVTSGVPVLDEAFFQTLRSLRGIRVRHRRQLSEHMELSLSSCLTMGQRTLTLRMERVRDISLAC